MKTAVYFNRPGWQLAVLLFCLAHHVATASDAARVTLLRAPDGGIQPQAAMDNSGAVHLIYYKGEPAGGDIFYVRKPPGQENFSHPIRVNTLAGSAMAIGTIRGAQMAVGKNGRVHIVWNGGKGAAPAVINGQETTPLLYTRLNDSGSAFEPERNVITRAAGLDGGSSVAADAQGNVYVTWHAPIPGNTNGEAGRAVFVARSTDEGATFSRETQAIAEPTGACGCCGMKAFADSGGNVFVLYRAASEMVNRNETLLVSHNRGVDFEIAYSHGWKVGTCPMSSAFLSETGAGVLAAAETHGRVFFVRVDPKTGKTSEPVSPESKGKHPVAISNARGEVLLTWTEDTGWAKGGAVVWQVFDATGNPISEKGRAEGVPVWSLATAFAKSDGDFVIVY
ncbi:MAG TPA: hypothetical protein VH598_01905 [Verrucomicrobiae bacterium]|nr:hypothetical protein [Verrucomicrobiae bacterium]